MFTTTTVTAPELAALFDAMGDRAAYLHPRVLAPDFRDATGMGTVARVVESATDTTTNTPSAQWTLTFADDVPGNTARLITSADRLFTLACTYDSGAATDCRPLCSAPATHVVEYRGGSYGPFYSLMCGRHVKSMEGRVYPGHIETRELTAR